jgi:hypothetical protein
MQLLTILWISSLWVVLALGLMFHAQYVVQTAQMYLVHEEREALLQAVMRVACVRYQSDRILQQEIAEKKRATYHCEVSQKDLGIAFAADCTYARRPNGCLLISLTVQQGAASVGTAEHLFSARALELARAKV